MRDRGLELLKRVLGGDANFRKGQWEAIESALNSKKTFLCHPLEGRNL